MRQVLARWLGLSVCSIGWHHEVRRNAASEHEGRPIMANSSLSSKMPFSSSVFFIFSGRPSLRTTHARRETERRGVIVCAGERMGVPFPRVALCVLIVSDVSGLDFLYCLFRAHLGHHMIQCCLHADHTQSRPYLEQMFLACELVDDTQLSLLH